MRRRELVKLVRETKQNNRKFVLLVLLLFDLFCFSEVYKDKFYIVLFLTSL